MDDIITDLRERNVHITHKKTEDSFEFHIEAPLFLDSPWVHSVVYGLDYDLEKAYQEVGTIWAARLGYGYKRVFGVL